MILARTTAEHDQRAIRFGKPTSAPTVRVGLEVKEPAMDHAGSYIDLLAIQAVSPTRSSRDNGIMTNGLNRAALEHSGPVQLGVRTG